MIAIARTHLIKEIPSFLFSMQDFTTKLAYDKHTLQMDMFDVSFSLLKNATFTSEIKTHMNEEFSLTGFDVTMKRSPSPFFINVYLPTGLLTLTSLIGFIIPVKAEEGRRMALLVTVFLMLVNISSTERNRGPEVILFINTNYKISQLPLNVFFHHPD